MTKTGRIWAVMLESERFPFYRYICEDHTGGLWQFYLRGPTHQEIEEDHGDIIGMYVQWDLSKRVLKFME